MDPLSLSLAAVGVGLAGLGLFAPAVKACFEIWGLFELSQNYGHDYRIARRSYELQIIRTAWIMTSDTALLVKAWDKDTPESADSYAVKQALVGIKDAIKVCEGLMKKHEEPPGPKAKHLAERKDKAETKPTEEAVGVAETPAAVAAQASATAGLASTPEASRLKSPFRFLRRSGRGRESENTSSSTVHSAASLMSQHSATTETSHGSTDFVPKLDLSNPTLQEVQENFTRAQKIQQGAGHKIPWLTGEKKKFEDAVKLIKELNDALQDRLIIKYITANHSGLGPVGTSGNSTDDRNQEQLTYLHTAFQSLNTTQNRIVLLNVPLQFSLNKVLDDALVLFSGKKMAPGTLKFPFYAHKDSEDPEKAIPIFTEFRRSYAEDLPTLSAAGDLRTILQDSTSGTETLQLLGKFDVGWADCEVLLFQDFSNQHQVEGSLAEALGDNSWLVGNFQADHISLARVITNAFRSLEGTFAPSALPTPSNFLFYSNTRKKGKEKAPTNAPQQSSAEENLRQETVPPRKDNSSLLKLSLASGFGTPAIADTSSLWDLAQQTETPSIIVALGLILYQIGSWKRLEYDMSPHGVNDARDEAVLQISAVDKHLPGQFTAIVSACLRWKEDELNSITTGEMIQRVAASLRSYESDIRYRF